jgi:dTMP kinase
LNLFGKRWTKKRSGREYATDKRDIHEKDFNYLKLVQERYLYLAKKYKHIVKIECVKNGELRSIESIHKEVVRKVEKLLK